MQDDHQRALGVATGRREALEQLVGGLRRKAAAWRAEEAKRGKLAAALLWQFTEEWIARIEGVAAELEQQVAQLRSQEIALSAATPVKLKAPRPSKPKRARSR